MQFIRYGGLSSVKQKGYKKDMPTFHAPPTRRGVYAFPWPHVETFLLGKSVFDQRRMKWKKDEKGQKIKSHDDDEEDTSSPLWKDEKTKKQYDEMYEKDAPSEELEKFSQENRFLAEHDKPKKFTYTGELWHHLDVPQHLVLERKGDWIKTSIIDFKKALNKEVGKSSKLKQREGYGYSKDHLEVFIEKI